MPSPGPILAHGVGRVYESPLPLSLYLVGAAATVLASFAIRALVRTDRETPERRIAGLGAAGAIGTAAQAIAVLGVVLALVFAVLEPERGFTITPLLFWVGLIVGTTTACCVLGGLWERADPWTAILGPPRPGSMASTRRDPHARDAKPPSWVGPLLLYGLFWFELVSGRGFDPIVIAAVLLSYTLYKLSFQRRWGEGFALADPLSILFGFASRVSPLRIDDRGIGYRGWLAGLAERDPMPMALFVSVFVLLGSTTLDNLRETVGWSSLLSTTGLDAVPKMALDSVALAALALPFYVPFLACMTIARRTGSQEESRSEPLTGTARAYAWSLVPIGIAYVLAHNMPLLMTGVPGLVQALGERFGADVFAGYSASPQLVWFLEIGLIVGGHVLGVVSAHRVALRRAGSRAAGLRAHAALTVLMSGFTITTLYLLSLPLVTS